VAAMHAGVIEAVPLATLNGSLNILCPQAIILRVAMGKAWKETTMNQITTKMEFSERKTDHSGRVVHVSSGNLSGSVSTIV